MKKITSFFGLALVGSVALLLPVNAHAICSSGIDFGTYYSVVTGTTASPSLRSNFWAFDATAPTNTASGANVLIGQGVDNGPLSENGAGGGGWLRQIAAGLAVTGDWSGQGWDGCPDAASTVPNQRMAFSFSDVDGTGKPTYAVACVKRDPAGAPQFNLDSTGAATIALVAAPKAITTNWVRSGTNEAAITVASPNFSPGFYTDNSPGCTLATVIPQYDVYKQQIARNAVPDPTTDTTAAWVLVGTGNTGSPFSFTTNCGATNCDLYLATVPHFQGAFSWAEAATASPGRIGDKSVKLQAGPTLADTPIRGNKKINNPGGTKSQQ
jgi:hypothetical protein